MAEYDFTLSTKYSLYLYAQKKKKKKTLFNQITQTKIIFKPPIKNNKKITSSGLMVVGGQ